MMCQRVFVTFRPQNIPVELANSTKNSGNTDSTVQSRPYSLETVVIDIKFDVMYDNCISFALACFYICMFMLRIMKTEL